MPFIVSSGRDSPPPAPSPEEPDAPKAKSTAVEANFKSQGLKFHISKIPTELKKSLDPKNTSCDVQIRDNKQTIRVVVPLGKNVIFRTSQTSFLMILQNGDVFFCSQPYTLEKIGDGQVDIFLKPSCSTSKEGIFQIDNCCKVFAGNFTGSEQRTATLNNRVLNPLIPQFPSPRKQIQSRTSVKPLPPGLPWPQTSASFDLIENDRQDTDDNLVVDFDQNDPPDSSNIVRLVSDEEIDGLLSIDNVHELEEAAEKLYDKIQIEEKRNELREKKKKKSKVANTSGSQNKDVFSPLSEHLQAAKSSNSSKKPKIVKEKKKSDPTFLCTECGKLFNSKLDLVGHKRVHLGIRPFVCNTCGHKFHTYNMLYTHKISHRPPESKPFSCNDCKTKYATAATLQKHRSTFHSDGQKRIPIRSPLRICERCGLYVRQKYLKRHWRKCINTPSKVYANRMKHLACEYCSMGPFEHFGEKKNHLLQEHIEKAAYSCLACDKKFFTYDSFRAHKRVCRDSLNCTSRNCEFCSETFPDIKSKQMHRRDKHREQAAYKCTECTSKFFSLVSMQSHRRKKHKDLNGTRTKSFPKLKDFICKICSPSCVTNYLGFARHLRWYHPGEYKYFCKFCVSTTVTVVHNAGKRKEHSPRCSECSKIMFMRIDQQ